MTHHIRSVLVGGIAAALAVAAPQPAHTAEAAGGPNVVFILADDLGYSDLGCYGSRYYETPHIDRMAAQGMRFTDGYACGPNCQPTRAALMSGQYGPRTGVYTVGGIERFNWQSRPLRPVDNVQQLPRKTVTVAQSLKSAGYVTGMFGKWHLGQRGEFHPGERGFDEAIVSMGQHFDFNTDPRTDSPPGTYLADFLTDKAIDFIRRNRERPFFLYLPHFGVHSPFQAKPELIAKFKDKPAAGGHHDPTYAAMIASVDESVGRVLAALDELGLDEKTLVIFSSDNGGVGGYGREGIAGRDVTDNAPLRSGKGSLYEGGIRVPWIFRWPGRIKPGTTCGTPILSIDLYPTLLKLADAEPPAGSPLDGVSLVGLVTSEQSGLDREAVYWHFPGYLGSGRGTWRTTPVGVVRAGDWKLLEFFEDGRLELYNLREDVGERNNLADQQPEKAKQLQGWLSGWREALKAPMPAKNEAGAEGGARRRARSPGR
ncbi:MAG TPA: sulfatase [Planctomycetaceae bacterium]|nr:sulfatase [Planctomycetaceae bacterium]